MAVSSLIIACSLAYSVSTKSVHNDYAVMEMLTTTRVVMKSSSDNLSQLVRSNVAHYWGWSKKNLKSYPDFAEYTSAQGIVAGDPHLGNFLFLPLKDASGRTKLKYTNADLDDAGRGSYAVDFARLAVAVKAITTDVKYKDLVESYALGLKQKSMEMPETLTEILETYGVKEYREELAEYVNERVEDGQFIHKEGKVESYRGSLTKKEIQTLFPNSEVLDLAKRPQDRGGSNDSERIWVLVNEKGRNTIYELKSWEPTRLTAWSPQKSVMTWLKEATAVFDPQGSSENFRLERMSNGKTYWVREKKLTLIDIPYSANKDSELDYINDLATYAAYQLGRWHGQQASAKKYANEIAEDPDAFREAVKPFVKDYLEKIEQEFED